MKSMQEIREAAQRGEVTKFTDNVTTVYAELLEAGVKVDRPRPPWASEERRALRTTRNQEGRA